MPIFVPIALFFQLTYNWWVGLRTSGRILFFILLPIYAPLALFMNWLFPKWTELAK